MGDISKAVANMLYRSKKVYKNKYTKSALIIQFRWRLLGIDWHVFDYFTKDNRQSIDSQGKQDCSKFQGHAHMFT
jgi:hypothetical protein